MAEKYKWGKLKVDYEKIKNGEKDPSKSYFVETLDVIFRTKNGYVDLLKNAIKGFYAEIYKDEKTYINLERESEDIWCEKRKKRVNLYNQKYKKPILDCLNSMSDTVNAAKRYYDRKKIKGPKDRKKIAFLNMAGATIIEKAKRYFGDDVPVQLISSGGYGKRLEDILNS